MRVRQIQCMSGPRCFRAKGEEWECNDAEAVRLINAGIAERVTAPEKTGGRKKVTSKTEYR